MLFFFMILIFLTFWACYGEAAIGYSEPKLLFLLNFLRDYGDLLPLFYGRATVPSGGPDILVRLSPLAFIYCADPFLESITLHISCFFWSSLDNGVVVWTVSPCTIWLQSANMGLNGKWDFYFWCLPALCLLSYYLYLFSALFDSFLLSIYPT